MGCKFRSKPNNAKPAMFRISVRVVDLGIGSNGKGMVWRFGGLGFWLCVLSLNFLLKNN
jgi:hypothetical protein